MPNPFINPHLPFEKISTKKFNSQLSKDFYQLNIKNFNQSLFTKSPQYWNQQGEKKALRLFHLAAIHIPAYKDFLKTHHLDHNKISSIRDFSKVPPTDKANYISKYPLESLMWNGKISTANIISLSSGTSGKPYLWPRNSYQDFEGAFQFEHLLTYLFQIDKKSTLVINCFSMGNYVAGTYVLSSIKLLSQKGYPLTLVTPGINYQDILNMLSNLKNKFEQIIICGYPPFLRDVIDIGIEKGFDFSELNCKFFFASEFFSENWRDYTLSLTGKRNQLQDSTNIFGTADSAIFCFETPASIMIRKMVQYNQPLNQALFSSKLTPTLTQYNPLLTFFQTIDSELHLTANSGVPLIKYNLKDHGSILSKNQIVKTFENYGIDFYQELKGNNISNTLHNLPFVFVTNRSDNAVSFYAIKIFPDYIRDSIETKMLSKLLTGKFTLTKAHNSKHHPQLIVHIELNSHTQPSLELKKIILNSVVKSLKRNCDEYRFLISSIGDRAIPIIKLHSYQQSQYFKIGIKQKWLV
jgi:phenylacetate-CoA ligase